MSDPIGDAFFETARRKACLRIDAVRVNSGEVVVDVTAKAAGKPSSRFEMEIGRATLHQELNEAGVELELDELEAFVRRDVTEHPQEALSGYLGIVRSIAEGSPEKPRWRLFDKLEPVMTPKWVAIRAEEVSAEDERLVIRGIAVRIEAVEEADSF